MKRIYLVRHAKSSWEYNVSDHDRPLKGRGNNDAEIMASFLKDKFNLPEKIISSTANRAKSTAKYFINHWKIKEDQFSLNRALYDFSGGDLIKTIKECDDSVKSLMIFGHNFAITDFVNTFGNLYIDNVPTCGFVVIDFEIDSWKNLTKGQTVYKLFPKEIRETNA